MFVVRIYHYPRADKGRELRGVLEERDKSGPLAESNRDFPSSGFLPMARFIR